MSLIDNDRIDEYLRQGRIEEALRQPLKGSDDDDRLRDFLGGGSRASSEGSVLYGGLTLGQFLYDWIRIDPKVVEGVDFVRSEDLSTMWRFWRFAERQGELTGRPYDGSLSQLQGYVAERFVAQHLEDLGHDITFPETANQAGFDLLVDGDRLQVKCLESAQSLREHLERYPDVPVVANVEMETYFIDDPRVDIDPALFVREVRAATEESLEAARDLDDFEVPWISLAVSGGLALRDLLKRDTDVQGAITTMVTATAGRIACGQLGTVTAQALGGLLFGPAGALLGGYVGAVGGARIGSEAARVARRLLTAAHEEELIRRCAFLAERTAEEIPRKLVAWEQKGNKLRAALDSGANSGVVRDHLIARLGDDVRYFENKREQLGSFALGRNRSDDALTYARKLLTVVGRAAVNTRRIQGELQQVMEAMRELIWQRRRYKLA